MTLVDNNSKSLLPLESIEKLIYIVRGHRVIIDSDLADLYSVETKVFNQAVKRNINRFPKDFMFQLTGEELEIWRSQIVTSNPAAKMGLRRRPYAFTEYGVAMLSSVLKSDRAIQINIQIMRAFIRMRQLLASQKGLMAKILSMEKKYDKQFKIVFQAIYKLMEEEEKPKREIGFKSDKNG